MHHKRKKATTRGELKRIESKQYRMAEGQAMDGHLSPTCWDSWGHMKNNPLPLVQEVSNGKKRSKRNRKPKDKCPNNRVHEWFKEWRVERREGISMVRREGEWIWVRDSDKDYDIHIYTATCIHCWKEKRLKTEYDPPRSSWREARRKSLVLKKRPVQF